MPTPTPAVLAPEPTRPPFWLIEQVKPYLAPYYLTIAAVLGAITVSFAIVTALIVLVVTNFNVLDWME